MSCGNMYEYNFKVPCIIVDGCVPVCYSSLTWLTPNCTDDGDTYLTLLCNPSKLL